MALQQEREYSLFPTPHDPWGVELKFTTINDETSVSSAGEDGEWDTEDDVVHSVEKKGMLERLKFWK